MANRDGMRADPGTRIRLAENPGYRTKDARWTAERLTLSSNFE